MLEIVKIVNGFLEENCYVIHNGSDALIVDPGSEEDKIFKEIEDRNLKVIGVLVTHYHFDHVGALKSVCEKYKGAKLIDYKTKGDVTLGMFKFKIIETFGHTMDSVSFYFDNNDMLFSGDFIFKETIGNFEEDNMDEMTASLNVFKYLSNNVKVYPGHGNETSVEHEKKYNPFLRGI